MRRRPALEELAFAGNSVGDEGIAALVAPPPLAGGGALPPATGVLTKLRVLYLSFTKVADAGCVALASALDSGMLPALERLGLTSTPASAAAKESVRVGRAGLMVWYRRQCTVIVKISACIQCVCVCVCVCVVVFFSLQYRKLERVPGEASAASNHYLNLDIRPKMRHISTKSAVRHS